MLSGNIYITDLKQALVYLEEFPNDPNYKNIQYGKSLFNNQDFFDKLIESKKYFDITKFSKNIKNNKNNIKKFFKYNKLNKEYFNYYKGNQDFYNILVDISKYCKNKDIKGNLICVKNTIDVGISNINNIFSTTDLNYYIIYNNNNILCVFKSFTYEFLTEKGFCEISVSDYKKEKGFLFYYNSDFRGRSINKNNISIS